MPDPKSSTVDTRRTPRVRRDIRERMSRAVLSDWQTLDDKDIAIFSIRHPDGSGFPEFEVGQYTQLAFWDQATSDPRPRQLSIASSPLDLSHLEFYVILVRDALDDESNTPGIFTGTLWDHKPGDEILYLPRPAGRFTLSRTDQPEVICIATGTGLAPFVSMARAAWYTYKETGKIDRRLTIVHGVSYANQLGYRDELEAMAADTGFGLSYIPSVSRPDADPNYSDLICRGRANDLVRLYFEREMSGRVEPWFAGELLGELRNRLAPTSAAVYLCGNPDMIADVKPVLTANGYKTEGREAQVITEDYW
jgi:ferredoxin--NADP+ reductase